MAQNYLFKLIIAGSGGSGKTTLLHRFRTGAFSNDTKLTIGVDFSVAKTKNATLQIWDFGGEERFRDVLPQFCLGSNGCLLVYDLSNPKSFYDLDDWIQIIRNNTKSIPIVLLGTKLDLIEDGVVEEQVDKEDVEEFQSEFGIEKYMRTSSKAGVNVKSAFEEITELMVERAQ